MTRAQSARAVWIVMGLVAGAQPAARAEVTIVHDALPSPAPQVAAPVQQQPAVQAPPAQNGGPNDVEAIDQRDLDDLVEKQKKLQAAMGAASAILPGHGGDVSSSAGAMNVIVKNPMAATFANEMAQTVRDPAFMKDAGEIMKNPNMKWMYGALIVYAIAFIFLRKLVMATSDRFLVRLLMSAGLFGVFVAGYFAIAYGALGDPFVRVATVVGKAALKAVQVVL